MGSPSDEAQRSGRERQHRVTLTKGFFLQTTEVTQGQWKAVMESNPSHFTSCGDDCPVEKVSWNDVQDFIRKLNRMKEKRKYRLPTETEWEYACRAGTKTPFSYGRCLSTDQANYHGDSPLNGCSKGKDRKKTLPVGSLSPNAWGLYDMHGNVWEWCQDRYGKYPSNFVTDPEGPSSGSVRVTRGGSWLHDAGRCRSSNRSRTDPDDKFFDLGFRLACDPVVGKPSTSPPQITRKGRLYINVEPQGSRIHVLDISSPYRRGMELKEGRYFIEVSYPGYHTEKKWISLKAEEGNSFSFRLKLKNPQNFTNNLV